MWEKKSFENGLNGDDSHTRLAPGEYFNGFNFRGSTSETGHVSGLQPIPSTTSLFSALPAGTNYCIGGCYDEAGRRLIWCNWNSGGNHGIYCYDTVALITTTVLLSSQVNGGLNFDRYHYIHSCLVLNGIFYWTDNFNEPRRINISAGIAMNNQTYNLIPNTNYLPVSNVDPNNGTFKDASFLVFTFQIPTNPVPGYASEQISYKLYFSGINGNSPAPIQVFMLWAPPEYPNKTAAQVFADGVVEPLTLIGIPGVEWDVYATNTTLTIYIKNTWDFGTGDPHFSPTAKLNILVNNYLNADGSIPNPYVAPINQQVLSLIRRQPGLPPIAAKGDDISFSNNFTGTNAYQLSYRFQYRDYELSTLSGQSNLINYNAAAEGYNCVNISLPLGEIIDQDVIKIDLVALYLVSGNDFVIKTWNIEDPIDAAAIAAHNAGTAPLAYTFYDNQSGTALDSAYSVKPYDSVPVLAQTIEAAKNKLFAGGTVLGYDSPNTTSLTAMPVTGSSTVTTPSAEWYQLSFLYTVVGVPSIWNQPVLYISNFTGYLGGNGYYSVTGLPPGPSLATSVPFGDLHYLGPDPLTAASTLSGQTITLITGFTDQGVAATITGLPSSTAGGGQTIFKTSASYQVAIEFLDYAGRKSGIVSKQSLLINSVDRNYSTVPYTNGIKWQLSNTNALAEIPVWASYYSILITKCLRTRFFLQGSGANACYATKEPASGDYIFTEAAYSPLAAGCAFDISNILAFQMGYTFSAGDVIKIYQPAGFLVQPLWELPIIAIVGNWVVASLQNINPVLNSSTQFLFEIYTPYKRSATEPFYECGQFFKIANPGTNNRMYGVPSGIIGGDITVLARGLTTASPYYTEAMSPNDNFWQIWNTNSGRPNFMDTIGQSSLINSISFSNVLTQGSRTNGLSTFDALDTVDLPTEMGAIQKLKLTSKIEKEGSIMLAICISETVSLYLGEVQVAAPQGNAFLSTATGTVGTIYPLKGSFGTVNPESVQEYRGDALWLDAYNGGVVQYSSNGLELVSRYKMRTFWRKWCRKYLSLTQAQVAALGSHPFVVGGIDPFNGEYLLSLPQLETNNPNGLLPGGIAGAPANLFELYDGMSKTMVYKIEINQWKPSYSYSSEALITVANLLYGFKNGGLWLHNDESTGSYNVFYGVAYPAIIMFSSTELPNSPKLHFAINVESDLQPDACYIMADYPNQQITDLIGTDWNDLEGVFYTTLFKDRLTPAFAGNYDLALNFGDFILAKSAMIQLNFIASKLFQLKYVNVGYRLSSGHRTLTPK